MERTYLWLIYYHHQIGSIRFSYCCHMYFHGCVYEGGCTIMFCQLLHIYPRTAGFMFPIPLRSLCCMEIIGYIIAWRLYFFVCTLHHLIIIIMQIYLKVLNIKMFVQYILFTMCLSQFYQSFFMQYMFSASHFPVYECEHLCISFYCHHQINHIKWDENISHLNIFCNIYLPCSMP